MFSSLCNMFHIDVDNCSRNPQDLESAFQALSLSRSSALRSRLEHTALHMEDLVIPGAFSFEDPPLTDSNKPLTMDNMAFLPTPPQAGHITMEELSLPIVPPITPSRTSFLDSSPQNLRNLVQNNQGTRTVKSDSSLSSQVTDRPTSMSIKPGMSQSSRLAASLVENQDPLKAPNMSRPIQVTERNLHICIVINTIYSGD
ncbi:hypothetical protein J3R30DRAFT_2580836 [Lentinula aciculospora]|uniref:Uncharacterized protein n=1 Tax=Lentinula aciculospora TaxID=153920 RepID=A0A9W9DPQ1_9AGAR|nr:hypothetical protein J3R30DRAFT_2580836 [Lentinula aciculospora]